MKLPEASKGWVFAGIGVLLSLAAVVYFVASLHVHDSMASADGTVTRVYAGHPEVEFTTPAGQVVHFSESAATNYSVGERVRVLYEADDPERRPTIDTAQVKYFGPLTAGVLGVGFLIVGIWYARTRRRRKPTVA